MSFLDKEAKRFKENAQASSNKLSQRRTIVAPSTSAPTPVRSSTPSGSQNGELKRKRPDEPKVVYSQPVSQTSGQNIMTQVHFAIEYLKNKMVPLSLDDIISYLSVQGQGQGYRSLMQSILREHDKVLYDPGLDRYEFRPAHNIRNGEQLIAHLQSQRSAKGLNVKELRDGWPGAEDVINGLEADGKLLVTRNKKDDHAKMVWLNDASLRCEIDPEFQGIWHKIKLPDQQAVEEDLEKAGLISASKMAAPKAVKKVEQKKRKAPRKGGRKTNVHMQGIFKDYSHLKP